MAAQYTPPTTAEVNALFGSSCYVCGKCNAGKLCARPGCGHRLEHGKIYGQGRFCHRNKCTEAAGVTKCKRCKHFLSMPVARVMPMPQPFEYMKLPDPPPAPTDAEGPFFSLGPRISILGMRGVDPERVKPSRVGLLNSSSGAEIISQANNDWKVQYLVSSAFKLTEDKAPQTALRWVDADVLRQRRDYKEQKAEFLGACCDSPGASRKRHWM